MSYWKEAPGQSQDMLESQLPWNTSMSPHKRWRKWCGEAGLGISTSKAAHGPERAAGNRWMGGCGFSLLSGNMRRK